ncbi:MAG: FAD-dependent thymidylate synthase [Acidobacteria bacterium]|nr:FAD-dependent thymidylate synthase [Acidobacteriota bacterium]
MDGSGKIERLNVPALDEILGVPFRVLNDGFIRLIDYMGSDESIVQAARVSYGKGTKKVHQDRGLIRYLMRHRHTTPFEMCDIKLHVRVPMDCWRQWIRHRTASVNEYSTRYSEAIDSAQLTGDDQWREQSRGNRQGSTGFLTREVGSELSEGESSLIQDSRRLYRERLEAGVAREQARKDLPLSTYTEAYWKIDLHNLLHFLALRMDAHAQWEIRSYATVIGEQILRRWCPITWEAFQDYRFHSTALSRREQEIIRMLAAGRPGEARDLATQFGLLNYDGPRLKPNRERRELEQKLQSLNFKVPWLDG